MALSASEQAQLEGWYAEQDKMESALLGPTDAPQHLTGLQTQVKTALVQLLTVTQRMQELTAQNDAVRREIAMLQRQLAHVPTRQPA